jgi:GTP-binding nuclear protein Ran
MDHRFKVVLVGDGGTGKTTFIHKYRTGEFNYRYTATLGVEVQTVTLRTNYGRLTLELWDTAGQEKFSGLGPSYYVGAHAAMIFFDAISMVTYRNVNNWGSALKRICPDIHVVVCGNKSDIVPLAQLDIKMNQVHYGISVKTGSNCEKPLLFLARRLTGKPDLVFV